MRNNGWPLKFKFGDLVSVEGYEGRVFYVDGFRIETYVYPDETWTDHVVELADAVTGEWLEAEDEDCRIVADASQADEYVRNIDLSTYPKPQLFIFEEGAQVWNNWNGWFDEEKRPLTARERSAKEAEERKQMRKLKAEIIDELLDEMNDYKRLYAEFGDEEYNDRVMAIEAELFKLTTKENEV
jgi:hypothetical protein